MIPLHTQSYPYQSFDNKLNQNKFIHHVQTKSTFSSNKPKTIEILPQQNKFVIYKRNDYQNINRINQDQQYYNRQTYNLPINQPIHFTNEPINQPINYINQPINFTNDPINQRNIQYVNPNIKQQNIPNIHQNVPINQHNLSINNHSHIRSYPLDQITYSYQNSDKDNKQQYLHIDTNEGKKYIIKSSNLQQQKQLIRNIQKGQQINKINKLQKQSHKVLIPKHYQYKNNITPLQSGIMNIQKVNLSGHQINNMKHYVHKNYPYQDQYKNIVKNNQNQQKYSRRLQFIKSSDWKIDKKKGGLIFINQQKKKLQSKILKFLIKKFISTGSFMGISFPTFAMKPQSILQIYGKACGQAPILFQNVMPNSVQKMKKVLCFLHSFSIIFADMQKPFNPVLGQTYQALIAGGKFVAQQISHHPPISAFIYEGKNYRISAAMQLTANIGANSATGLFLGDIKVQFNDGGWYKGKLVEGQFSGFMIGQNKFETYGTGYVYDNKKLVCSYSTKQKINNNFEGFIGKLKDKYYTQFCTKINNSQRFIKFPFYDRKCFQVVYSSMQMLYNSHTSFDGKQYLNLHQQKFLPFLPQNIINKQLLLSDSRYRKDIQLRKLDLFQEAQIQKQKIQEQQRMYRKLRAKYDPYHHQNS